MSYGKKKSYLDLFLENNSTPKKRERYFEDLQEKAIIKYNHPDTTQDERNILFKNIIDTCFKKTISGVLEMPKFRNIPKALNREDLIDLTYFRLIEKIHKFREGMISKKSGLPVKAFSYFSTIAKNYILEQITKHNKILKHKADVESSIDLTILSEDNLSKLSKVDSHEMELDDYVSIFNSTKKNVIEIVKELIIEEENKEKKDQDFIKLGYCLKYLLQKWGKIEFFKKNEFMRILTLYSGLPQQKVSFLFKRFKNAVLKKIKPSALNKIKKKDVLEIDEDIFLINENEDDLVDIDELDELDIDPEDKEETEEEKLMKYEINSMEEFEIREYKLNNAKSRRK